MTWGRLGDIELGHPLIPTTFRRGYNYGYAEKDRISGKSGLQQTPDALQTINMAFAIHYQEGNEAPQTYLQRFLDAAEAKEALPMVVGGQLLGNFVITALPVSLRLFSADGLLLEVQWDVRLLEYADQVQSRRQKVRGFLKRVRS